jgi:YjjG family noncanonical pyrimidine nucleotidase
LPDFKHKKHLFFDLDHTLWDYERNCFAGLELLYNQHELQNEGIPSVQDFYDCFFVVNKKLWELYDTYQISSAELRLKRFRGVFEYFGSDNFALADSLGEVYIDITHRMPHLLAGAKELLDYLAPNYTMHIITNGFEAIQHGKLKYSGIAHYFTEVITSEGVDAKKPQLKMFEAALAKANTNKEAAIMIGDNPIADIHGALQAGWDAIWYNNIQQKSNFTIEPNVTVTTLVELKQFF